MHTSDGTTPKKWPLDFPSASDSLTRPSNTNLSMWPEQCSFPPQAPLPLPPPLLPLKIITAEFFRASAVTRWLQWSSRWQTLALCWERKSPSCICLSQQLPTNLLDSWRTSRKLHSQPGRLRLCDCRSLRGTYRLGMRTAAAGWWPRESLSFLSVAHPGICIYPQRYRYEKLFFGARRNWVENIILQLTLLYDYFLGFAIIWIFTEATLLNPQRE